jgi:hypothetical protein
MQEFGLASHTTRAGRRVWEFHLYLGIVFSDCRHAGDPSLQVAAAMSDGKISARCSLPPDRRAISGGSNHKPDPAGEGDEQQHDQPYDQRAPDKPDGALM